MTTPIRPGLRPGHRLAAIGFFGLTLAACASSNPAPIDYRTGANPATAARPPGAVAARPPIVMPATPPSSRPSSSPAVQEAAALAPETGSRPGGSLRQPRGPAGGQPITVARGDSLSAIAQRQAVNMRALIDHNALSPPYLLEIGQVLRLPPPNVHTVQPGETLLSVSRRFSVDTRSLAVMNGLERPWRVWPGDELLLPPLAQDVGAPPPPTSRVVALDRPAANPPSSPSAQTIAAAAPTTGPIALTPQPSAPIASPPPAPRPAPQPVAAAAASDFVWPARGEVLARFGESTGGVRNDGVKIAMNRGDPINAAAAGDVVYAGNELAAFGNLLLIRHPGGWVTAYAHADTLLVKEGDRVTQGQLVARAGSTGSASRPQLHFELRRGKDPVDPTRHLPQL